VPLSLIRFLRAEYRQLDGDSLAEWLLYLHHRNSELFFHPAKFDNFKDETISDYKTVSVSQNKNFFYIVGSALVMAAGLSHPGKFRKGSRAKRDRTGQVLDMTNTLKVPWSRD